MAIRVLRMSTPSRAIVVKWWAVEGCLPVSRTLGRLRRLQVAIEQVARPMHLCRQVASVLLPNRPRQCPPPDDLDPRALQACELVGIVGEQADPAIAKLRQHAGGNFVPPLIGRVAEGRI